MNALNIKKKVTSSTDEGKKDTKVGGETMVNYTNTLVQDNNSQT